MPEYILDKAYSIEDAAGVGAYLVVVHGMKAGAAKLPDAANAGSILGVTIHSVGMQGANVSVRKAGIARVRAAGPIALGAPVSIADCRGYVQEINHFSANCLGFAETSAKEDGDIIEVFISLHQRTAL